MKTRILKRIVFGVLTALAASGLVLGVTLLLQSPFFAVKKVNILLSSVLKSESPVSEQRVKDLSLVPMGENLFSMNLDLIQQRIEKDEWVERVQISKHLPNQLEIKIEVKKPRALMAQANRKIKYVDDQGVLFGDFELKYHADLPVLTHIPEDKIKGAVDYIRTWQSTRLDKKVELASIAFDEDQGYQAQLVSRDSRERTALILGEGVSERGTEDFERLEKVMQYAKDKNLVVRHIRADVSKKIVVKIARGL